MLKSLFKRTSIGRCQQGNIAIEAAFAIPMLVGLAVGTAEYGRAFSAKSELANIARAGAQAAIEFGGEDESLNSTVQNSLILAGLIGGQTLPTQQTASHQSKGSGSEFDLINRFIKACQTGDSQAATSLLAEATTRFSNNPEHRGALNQMAGMMNNMDAKSPRVPSGSRR